MALNEIKKELKTFEKEKLINLIAELYKKNKAVKEYLDFYVYPNERELFEKYRDIVFQAFYPKRGYALKLKVGKQAITDFKKLEPSQELLADLMLFYVETGVIFTNDFGDINGAFYNSLSSTFHNALTIMQKEDVLFKFEERARKIIDDTSHIGWGFHDHLIHACTQFYPSEEDND